MTVVDLPNVRQQILANAKLMFKPKLGEAYPAEESNGKGPEKTISGIKDSHKEISQSTLVAHPGHGNGNAHYAHYASPDLEVVVFGHGEKFTAALMWGLTPAISSDTASSPDMALRKLLLASAELLNNYVPKIGAHQRNIHGGGVYNEDLISPAIVEAQKKT